MAALTSVPANPGQHPPCPCRHPPAHLGLAQRLLKHAGIVNQHVKAGRRCCHLARQPPHLGQRSEVGHKPAGRLAAAAGARLPHCRHRLLHPGGVAARRQGGGGSWCQHAWWEEGQQLLSAKTRIPQAPLSPAMHQDRCALGRQPLRRVRADAVGGARHKKVLAQQRRCHGQKEHLLPPLPPPPPPPMPRLLVHPPGAFTRFAD